MNKNIKTVMFNFRSLDYESSRGFSVFPTVLLSYRSFIPQITRLLLAFYLFGPGFCKCV